MLMNHQKDQEEVWEILLSRQPERIRRVFFGLAASEQRSVLAHLNRMAEEPGWHPEQSASALAALEALMDKT